MNSGNPFKVLLYFDGSQHSFSAAVYTANLLKSIPSMHLTVLQVQDGSIGENNDMKPTWPTNPRSDWVKYLMVENDPGKKKHYTKIHARIKEIFSEKGYEVNQEVVYSNASIPDTVKAIREYATENEFKLIIMGTRGPTSLKGLMYGSLAHSLINKLDIPVLLIKKLPQEFIDCFCSSPSEKFNRIKRRSGHLHLAKTICNSNNQKT